MNRLDHLAKVAETVIRNEMIYLGRSSTYYLFILLKPLNLKSLISYPSFICIKNKLRLQNTADLLPVLHTCKIFHLASVETELYMPT